MRSSRIGRKNLVVCIDGTGQGFGGGKYQTNVSKLYNLVEDRTQNQIAFYDSGVGARQFDLSGKIMGTGMSAKICRAYQFIFDHMVSGDRIFLFGFSRGAAIVALLAEFLDLFGVLPVGHQELISEAYNIFDQKDSDKRLRQANSFVAYNNTTWCQIPFLGVWDTVVARGFPIQYVDQLPRLLGFKNSGFKYYYPRLPDSVVKCYHALAIDDERKIFHPRIWDSSAADHQSLKQVWFCGMHSDVGGGYKNSSLADISLNWMINKAVDEGLRLSTMSRTVMDEDPNGYMENSRSGVSRLYARKSRGWNHKTHGTPLIHPSVLKRKIDCRNSIDTLYSPWILSDNFEVETA
jgi:uncharacterized protein (DUF2235 family)